jgi:hypothetical protein
MFEVALQSVVYKHFFVSHEPQVERIRRPWFLIEETHGGPIHGSLSQALNRTRCLRGMNIP